MDRVRDLFDGLNLADKTVNDAARRGIGKAALRWLSDSEAKTPRVPLDEGTLAGSGSVHVNGEFLAASPSKGGNPTPNTSRIEIPSGNSVEACVGYNTPYAAYQHEGVRRDGTHRVENYSHQDGRGPKFLERPGLENREQYLGIAAREIQSALSLGK